MKKTTAKKAKTPRGFPNTMDDLQQATGMRPNTFRVWKAKNNPRLKRGLKNFSIQDPNNPNFKLFSNEYLERIMKLRAAVKTPNVAIPTKVRPGSFVVSLKPNQVEAFNTIAQQFHWKARKV